MTLAADLDSLRNRLDAVDDQLIETLAERFRLVDAIGKLKSKTERTVRDQARERVILSRVHRKAQEMEIDGEFVTGLYREIFEHSLVRQTGNRVVVEATPSRDVTVAYQGTEGAYGQLAATNHFSSPGRQLKLVGCDSFAAVVDAVLTQSADFGLLPVENTTAGSINEVYDLLGSAGLEIVGEQVQTVDHCLLGLPGATIESLRTVKSHPQALAQCSDFLRTVPHLRGEAFADTALAARQVRDDGDPTEGAIASAEAAELYGLQVIHPHVANQAENFTRFVAIGREPLPLGSGVPSKTSIVFDTAHEPGALLRCIDTLARNGLNLTKLESRPLPRMPWKYRFYVDFVTTDTRAAHAALAEMHGHTRGIVVLGTYAANVPGSGKID